MCVLGGGVYIAAASSGTRAFKAVVNYSSPLLITGNGKHFKGLLNSSLITAARAAACRGFTVYFSLIVKHTPGLLLLHKCTHTNIFSTKLTKSCVKMKRMSSNVLYVIKKRVNQQHLGP